MTTRSLIPLGDGAYTVSEVCRILGPSMTPRKVHYWLNTGLLSEPPVAHHGRGVPTLLTFRQLLEVRTVQHMRDDLRVSLPRVRQAFEWVLRMLFAASPADVHFERGRPRTVIGRTRDDAVEIPTGQGVLDFAIRELNNVVKTSREAWEDRAYVIPGHARITSTAGILGGAPTVRGTRIETATLAAFADEGTYDKRIIDRARRAYPQLSRQDIRQAMEFEGVRERAA
jgi:uncharacterized protein (DUF433 family)